MSKTRTWAGCFKLVEEMGEVSQVIGKLGAFPEGKHPDGGPDLAERLEDELADLLAAAVYVVTANGLDKEKIITRASQKYTKFRHWGLTGITPSPLPGLSKTLASELEKELKEKA